MEPKTNPKNKTAQKAKFLPVVFIALLVIAAGCIGQTQPQPKHFSVIRDGVEYIFSNTLEEISNITLSGDTEILEYLGLAPNVNIVYRQGTDDDAMLAITATELSSKLAHYYRFTQKRPVEIKGINTAENGTLANITGANIFLRGPGTGATGNEVYTFRGFVFADGTDREGLTRAGDRLALLMIEDG